MQMGRQPYQPSPYQPNPYQPQNPYPGNQQGGVPQPSPYQNRQIPQNPQYQPSQYESRLPQNRQVNRNGGSQSNPSENA